MTENVESNQDIGETDREVLPVAGAWLKDSWGGDVFELE